MEESIFLFQITEKAHDIVLLEQITLKKKKNVLMAFQNKDELLCSNSRDLMGKGKK